MVIPRRLQPSADVNQAVAVLLRPGDGHNARGQWLIAEKAKREAKEVDVAWLKECPSDKK